MMTLKISRVNAQSGIRNVAKAAHGKAVFYELTDLGKNPRGDLYGKHLGKLFTLTKNAGDLVARSYCGCW